MNWFHVTVWQPARAEPLLQRLGTLYGKRYTSGGGTVFWLCTAAIAQHVKDVLWAGCVERCTVQPIPRHIVDEFYERST